MQMVAWLGFKPQCSDSASQLIPHSLGSRDSPSLSNAPECGQKLDTFPCNAGLLVGDLQLAEAALGDWSHEKRKSMGVSRLMYLDC